MRLSRNSRRNADKIIANRKNRGSHILLFHRDAAHGEHRPQVEADPEPVLIPEKIVERLRSQIYDLVVSECSSSDWQGKEVLQLLREIGKDPFMFVTSELRRRIVVELAKGGADCLEMDPKAHLPLAVGRVLGAKTLREERDRVLNELRHSEAKYHALAENPIYGICRCAPDGEFLEVNQALVTMLGCASKEDLMALRLTGDLVGDSCQRAKLQGHSFPSAPIGPVEIDWKRKDGATVKVRLSGCEVRDKQGKLEGYEIIAEDITQQRELENELRQQADSDPLTGLGNYRKLVDVLNAEIERSMRTGREFSVLFFDVDRLKAINDLYGHLTGSRVLRRLANALSVGCRSVDTAARFGGDEFILVLPETGAETAIRVARRIRLDFANDGEQPRFSVSVGVATYPRDGGTMEDLLRAADRALYEMKGELENFQTLYDDV